MDLEGCQSLGLRAKLGLELRLLRPKDGNGLE
jgi:hypothetical protein